MSVMVFGQTAAANGASILVRLDPRAARHRVIWPVEKIILSTGILEPAVPQGLSFDSGISEPAWIEIYGRFKAEALTFLDEMMGRRMLVESIVKTDGKEYESECEMRITEVVSRLGGRGTVRIDGYGVAGLWKMAGMG